MERLKISKSGLYEIIEQPGNGTKYSFLIQVKDEIVVVSRDMYAGNVGPDKPVLLHRDMIGIINKDLTGNAHKDVKIIVTLMKEGRTDFELNATNPYTVGAIYRCAAEAIKLWHKDTASLSKDNIKNELIKIGMRTIESEVLYDAISEHFQVDKKYFFTN